MLVATGAVLGATIIGAILTAAKGSSNSNGSANSSNPK